MANVPMNEASDSAGTSVTGSARRPPESYRCIFDELQSCLDCPPMGNPPPDVQKSAGSARQGRRPPKAKEKSRRLGVQKKFPGDVNFSRREKNAVVERERRRNMLALVTALHSLLPDSRSTDAKKDQCSVLEETVRYIPLARSKLEELQRRKALLLSAQRPGGDSGGDLNPAEVRVRDEIGDGGNSRVAVNAVGGSEGLLAVTLSTAAKFGALSDSLAEIEKQGLEVVKFDVFQSSAALFRYIEAKHDRTAPRVASCESLQRRLEQVAFRSSIDEKTERADSSHAIVCGSS